MEKTFDILSQQFRPMLMCYLRTRRAGNDALNIPWQTAKIYSGISKLNEILGRDTDEAVTQQQQKVDALAKELAAVRKQWRGVTKGTGPANAQDKIEKLFIEEKRLAEEFNSALEQLAGYQLKVANAMWLEQTRPANQNYVATVNKAFKTGGVQMANFNTGDERDRINAWIAENTNQKIQGFLQPGILNVDTRLVLANAIYSWDASRTQPDKRLLVSA